MKRTRAWRGHQRPGAVTQTKPRLSGLAVAKPEEAEKAVAVKHKTLAGGEERLDSGSVSGSWVVGLGLGLPLSGYLRSRRMRSLTARMIGRMELVGGELLV